jgi:sugar phosphate isomerase/epimerase
MKICASSTLLFAYPLEEVLNIAKRLVYDGVEIWHFHLIKTGEVEKCAKLRELAQQLGLSLSFHALSWDLNFTSKLDEVRETSLRLLEGSIDLAAELNANPVVIHPGRITIPGDSAEEYWPFLIEGVKRLTSYAQSKKINVALEVMEHIKNEFYIKPEDANRILAEVPAENLGITFDAAHVPLEIDTLDYITRIDKVMHVHLSDLTSEKRHIALNTGDRDFTELVKYVINHLQTDIAVEGMEYQRSEGLANHNIVEMGHYLQSAKK